MNQLHQARELRNRGLYRDALAVLDRTSSETDRHHFQALRSELLEVVGRSHEAQVIIKRLLPSKTLPAAERATCDFVLARVAIERNDFDGAVAHLKRSITYAQRAGDLERLCGAQLKLLLLLADGAGTDATGPLLAEVRANAARTGNPKVLAAVHVYYAQMEGLRSSVSTSRRHIKLAQQLLDTSPNAWLEAIVANIELSLALMESEFGIAKEIAKRGLECAQRCGSAVEFAVNRSNAGYAFQMLGDLSAAESCYQQALELFLPGSEAYNGTLDSLARIRLSQNRLDECEDLLNQIDRLPQIPPRRATYVNRHVQFTRAQLLIRRRESEGAERQLEKALRLSREACDPILITRVQLEQIELKISRGDVEPPRDVIEDVSTLLPQQSLDIYAKYQEVLGAAAQRRGDYQLASDHLGRAERICWAVQHEEPLKSRRDIQYKKDGERTAKQQAQISLQSINSILAYNKHPEFLALELLDLLSSTGEFEVLAATIRGTSGCEEVFSNIGIWPPPDEALIKRLHIGESGGGVIEVVLGPKKEFSALATFYAACHLVSASRDLKLAREERAERTATWPVEELPPSNGHQVVSGHMHELMVFAQRVARTNVNVLITGESGTGKEILARAIHDFSDRAQKPFVPFNCSAVPRDLLESQLFGHRRGAFTGAERDQLGLIRSASGGTLFLDEVGDLSLDLQPKLLRFLESGEIAPLGEPSPFKVNVRIVAATNSNLEDAVRDGKFREDLFYRLNVVRLTVKPLRERRDEIPGLVNHFVEAAAREHKKGPLQVSEDTMERLILYRWPGNVRQLQNEVRRMVALAEPNSTIEPESLSPAILGAMPNLRHTGINGREITVPLHDKLLPTLSRIEYEMVKAALREHRGKVEPAAKSLGISRKGLYLKRQRFGL